MASTLQTAKRCVLLATKYGLGGPPMGGKLKSFLYSKNIDTCRRMSGVTFCETVVTDFHKDWTTTISFSVSLLDQ